MPFLTAEPVVRLLPNGTTFELVEPLVYKGKRQSWTISAGFTTDFASIPAIVTWLIAKLGLWTLAAILHDWLCTALATYHRAHERGVLYIGPPVPRPPATARETDGIFRRILRENGVDLITRWLIWTGVRWGALVNPARRTGWIRDAPAVLAISLVALPFVLPPVLLAVPALLVKAALTAASAHLTGGR